MFNQKITLIKTSPVRFWVVVFLLSISGTFYLGLNPELIANWWWILSGYNLLMSLVAAYYIYIEVVRFKHNVSGDIIGAKFTWSLIKIVPILVIMPVLSFYLFSFQTIQDNVSNSEKTFDNFSKNLIKQVSGLYSGIQSVRDERYTEQAKRLLTVITSFGSFKKDDENYQQSMQIFLEGLVEKDWACQIRLFDADNNIIAQTKKVTQCRYMQNPVFPQTKNSVSDSVIEVKMSSKYLDIHDETPVLLQATYATEPNLSRFLLQIEDFSNSTNNIKFTLNTAITQKRFVIDFSSTVLLTLLSALIIVLRMIQRLMRPLSDLSIATREIAQGNYDVHIPRQQESADIHALITQFNIMSQKIKSSREGLDTHNLYLETILKYSYSVIALDQNKKIRLINPVIKKMLGVKNGQIFIGKKCESIAREYPDLKPFFMMTMQNFKHHKDDWSEEIEISLAGKQVLLSCQGAALEVEHKILGYVIVVKDISKLNRAQKKAAWGEVARRMAHEIKNPLTPIMLSAQRLRHRFMDKLVDKDLQVIDKTTNTIIAQVKSMDTMVSAFADYANTPSIKRIPSNLNHIVKDSLSLYHQQNDIDIKLNLAADMPILLLDASPISRVLINLIKNAIEATVDTQMATIEVSTQYLSKEDKVRLSIKDNGPGFEKEILDKVFEPYVTTKIKGSGLGMAIVQNIIEQHDGTIEVKNIEPQGAIITIEFRRQK